MFSYRQIYVSPERIASALSALTGAQVAGKLPVLCLVRDRSRKRRLRRRIRFGPRRIERGGGIHGPLKVMRRFTWALALDEIRCSARFILLRCSRV
jgi:hypothetical protein